MQKKTKSLLVALGIILTWLAIFAPAQAVPRLFLDGRVVLAPNGTIYLISEGTKRGFPSAAVYLSHGFDFADAQPASSEDLALPEGAVLTYADGTLVKGSDATVYIVVGEQKRPFVSAEVFLGLGYSFANIKTDADAVLAGVASGAAIDSADIPHPPGTLVNDNGTIYVVSESGDGRQGIPSMAVFNFHRFRLEEAVLANNQDRALTDAGLFAGEDVVAPKTPVGQPPATPEITGPSEVEVLVSQNFTVQATDAEGGELTYSFDWGNGSAFDTASASSSEAVTLAHTWSSAGDYTLTVRVTDADNNQAQAQVTVSVKPASAFNHAPSAPSISGVVATLPTAQESFSFSATDSDGDQIIYTVDWGDGAQSKSLALSSGIAFSASHSWKYIGDYTITVTAEDSRDSTSQTTYLIIVDSDITRFGPSVTVLTPNGGETFTQNKDVVKITWKRNWMPPQALGRVDIYFQRAGLNTLIKESANDGSAYDWIPQNLTAGSNYKIVVQSQAAIGPGVYSDESDSTFTLLNP